jgi:hypothetical protein
MPKLTLDAIQQRIAKQNSELQALRRELETRHNRLRSLAHRKEELQTKLRQIEAEMAAVNAGAKRPQIAAPKAAPKKTAPKPSAVAKSSPPSLSSLLLSALRSARRALTAKQLVGEVKRRGFKTESADFTKMVGTRLWGLKKQGIIRRATGQPGYTLAPSANGSIRKTEPAKAVVQKVTAKAPAKPGHGKAAAKPAPKPPSDAKVPQVPLREVVTQVLKKMGVPLTASELAEEVLKTGYKTRSKKFVNNIYVMLGLMDSVEHVEGQGYRLKRGKS